MSIAEFRSFCSRNRTVLALSFVILALVVAVVALMLNRPAESLPESTPESPRMSSAPATEDPEPEPTEEAEPTEVPETIEETTTLAPDIDEWSNGPLTEPEPEPQFVPMPEPSEESIATPAGPSQADIEYVRAERAYLEDQILQSDAYIARKTAALETSQYHLAVAEDYGDTLRARELRAEIKTLEADINTERLYGDMLRAELQALPDW